MTAKAYLLKIRGGVEVDSKGQKAGKGPLIAEEISNTLGTSQDQYLFQPIVLESHPNDSRVKIDDSGSIQTLTSRMGTGGGNVPMVMMPYSKSRRAKSADDFETWKESRVSNTINTFDQGDVRATDVVVCIQGNVIDRSDNAGANGAGWRTDKCYTLNTIDRPAVVYPKKTGPLMANSHPGSYSGQDAYQDMFVVEKCYGLDEKMGQIYIHEDKADTLAARDFLALAVENHPQDSRVKISEDNVNQPLSANMEHDASNGGLVLTLETFHLTTEEDKTAHLKARDYKDPLVIAMDRAAFNQGKNALYDFTILEEQSPTIVARGPNAVCVRKKED